MDRGGTTHSQVATYFHLFVITRWQKAVTALELEKERRWRRVAPLPIPNVRRIPTIGIPLTQPLSTLAEPFASAASDPTRQHERTAQFGQLLSSLNQQLHHPTEPFVSITQQLRGPSLNTGQAAPLQQPPTNAGIGSLPLGTQQAAGTIDPLSYQPSTMEYMTGTAGAGDRLRNIQQGFGAITMTLAAGNYEQALRQFQDRLGYVQVQIEAMQMQVERIIASLHDRTKRPRPRPQLDDVPMPGPASQRRRQGDSREGMNMLQDPHEGLVRAPASPLGNTVGTAMQGTSEGAAGPGQRASRNVSQTGGGHGGRS